MSDTEIETTGKTGTDQEFRSDVRRLGKHVGQVQQDLARLAKGADEAAHSGVDAVRQSGRSAVAAAKKRGGLATASLRTRISDHPGATLGVAVGVGILIGLVGPAILRSRRRSSSETETN